MATIELPVGSYPHSAGTLRVFRSDQYLRISFHDNKRKETYDWFWNGEGDYDGTGTGFDEPRELGSITP